MIALSWRDHRLKTKRFLLPSAHQSLAPIKSHSFPWGSLWDKAFINQTQNTYQSSPHSFSHSVKQGRVSFHHTGPTKKNAVQWAIRGLAGAQGALSSHSSIKVGSRTNIVFTLERSVKAGFQSECCRVGQGSAQTGGVICIPLGKDLKSFRLVSSAIKQR